MATNLRISTELGFNGTGFALGLKRAQGQFTQFARSIGAQLGMAFSIGGMAMLAKKAIDNASRIKDLADAIGITTEEVQVMDYAAKQTGSTVEDMAVGLKKVAQSQQSALEGNKAAIASWERLGFTLKDLQTMNRWDLFRELSKRMSEGKIGVQNMADLMDVLGKNAQTILPAMTSGFAEMESAARKAGTIIQDEIIQNLDDIGDSLSELEMMTLSWASTAVNSLSWIARQYQSAQFGLQGFFEGLFAGEGLDKAIERGAANMEAAWALQDEMIAQRREKRATERERKRNALQAARELAGEIVPTAKTSKVGTSQIKADALARIGGFTGRGILAVSGVEVLVKIERNTRQQLEATEKWRRILSIKEPWQMVEMNRVPIL